MAEPASQNDPQALQIRVASYSNTTWQGAWRARGRALWGTGALGVFSGIAVGGLISLALVATSAITMAALPGVLPIILLGCGAAGGAAGMAAANDLGGSSGAVGAGMAEWESRFKQMMVEAGLFDKRMVEKEPVSAALNRTEMVDTPEEVNQRGHMFKNLINWKAMAMFVLIGGAFGAALGAAGLFTLPIAASLLEPFGVAVGSGISGAIVGAVAVGGAGALFGFNYPIITNTLNNFFGKIFSGDWPVPNPPQAHNTPVPTPIRDADVTPPTPREEMMIRQAEMLSRRSGQLSASFEERLAAERSQAALTNQIH